VTWATPTTLGEEMEMENRRIAIIWIYHVNSELLGTCALKEEAGVAVGERSPRRNRSKGRGTSQRILKKKSDVPLGYLGRTALSRV
jgi:hypothetical protein